MWGILFFLISLSYQMDWQRGVLLIKKRMPMSFYSWLQEEKQIEEAREKLLLEASALLEGLPIGGDTLLKDLLMESSSFQEKYFTFLSSSDLYFSAFSGKYFLGSLQIPFIGENSLISLLPIRWSSRKYLLPSKEREIFRAYEKRIPFSFYPSYSYKEPFSSLVIDAFNVSFRPSFFTRLYTQEGWYFYGLEYLSQKKGISQGAYFYTTQLESAEVKRILGEKPFFISAIGSKGRYKIDLVLPEEKVAFFLSHPSNIQILQEARVIILYNPKKILYPFLNWTKKRVGSKEGA